MNHEPKPDLSRRTLLTTIGLAAASAIGCTDKPSAPDGPSGVGVEQDATVESKRAFTMIDAILDRARTLGFPGLKDEALDVDASRGGVASFDVQSTQSITLEPSVNGGTVAHHELVVSMGQDGVQVYLTTGVREGSGFSVDWRLINADAVDALRAGSVQWADVLRAISGEKLVGAVPIELRMTGAHSYPADGVETSVHFLIDPSNEMSVGMQYIGKKNSSDYLAPGTAEFTEFLPLAEQAVAQALNDTGKLLVR